MNIPMMLRSELRKPLTTSMTAQTHLLLVGVGINLGNSRAHGAGAEGGTLANRRGHAKGGQGLEAGGLRAADAGSGHH